jgi:hypothetical protein
MPTMMMLMTWIVLNSLSKLLFIFLVFRTLAEVIISLNCSGLSVKFLCVVGEETRMGNSLPPRLSVTDGCPLIPHQRQLVQQTIINAFQGYLSSSPTVPTSSSKSFFSSAQQQLLPIVLIDMIIDYSDFCTEMHIISLDSGRTEAAHGWISTTQLLPRHAPSVGTGISPSMSGTEDRPGWRFIYGTLPQRTYIQHVHLVNDYFYVIGYRNNTPSHLPPPTEPYRSPYNSSILMRCHVNDLFTSAFSSTIPSLDKRASLLQWQELASPPENSTMIPGQGRGSVITEETPLNMSSCVWKATRIFVVCEYWRGTFSHENGWWTHYYDTITNEWHVITKIGGHWNLSTAVLYNDYLFLHDGHEYVVMLHDATNTWLQLNNIRKKQKKHLRILVAAPQWICSLPISSSSITGNAPSSSSTATTTPISGGSGNGTASKIVIGTLSYGDYEVVKNLSVPHQLSYHIIDIHTGASTMIPSTLLTKGASHNGRGISRYQTDWKLPKWSNTWPNHSFYRINDYWFLLDDGYSKRSAVVAIDDIWNVDGSWKWYELFDYSKRPPCNNIVFYATSNAQCINDHT